jgi:hypothetical protein
MPFIKKALKDNLRLILVSISATLAFIMPIIVQHMLWICHNNIFKTLDLNLSSFYKIKNYTYYGTRIHRCKF